MEWSKCIQASITYIENNLTGDVSIEDIAKEVFVSPFYLQKGFALLTGYTISEYIRNRRLHEAAVALSKKKGKVVDIALLCGYETPESFTKAFTRFHGVTPSEVIKGASFVSFLPLHIKIDIQGGKEMDYKITKMFGLRIIGFQREFTFEEAQKKIPLYWDEICEKYCTNIYAGNKPANAYEKAIVDNCIGEYGVCVDGDNGKLRYIIGGRYTGGEIPEGMTLYEFPMGEWAIFNCVGPIPEALQSVTNKIFKEWLPNNEEFEIDGNANVEWYDCVNGNNTDPDYHSAVWIPIKRKVNK
ncbi:MAG: AraC family transcriptional regulator [Bacilli bacterium]|nr:AraC family transcriptional regulator [Bacilli bacterium]